MPQHEDVTYETPRPEPAPECDESGGAPPRAALVVKLAVVLLILEGLAWLAVHVVSGFSSVTSPMAALNAKAHCVEDILRAEEEWSGGLGSIMATGWRIRTFLAMWQGAVVATWLIVAERRGGHRPEGATWSIVFLVSFVAGLAIAALTLAALVEYWGERPTISGCY